MEADSVARGMPGTICAAMPRASITRSSGGSPGKSRERISKYAESQRTLRPFGEPVREARDLVGASTHEQSRIVDHSAHNLNAVSLEIARQIGRREQDDGPSDRAQRIKAADGQESGITRTQTRDTNQHVTTFGELSCLPRDAAAATYFVVAGAGEAAELAAGEAGVAAPGGAPGVAKSPANCGSFTTIVAFC